MAAALLAGGVMAAAAVSSPGGTTTGTTLSGTTATTTPISTTSAATTATDASSSSGGSTALYVALLIGLFLFIGVLYGLDLVRANRRQDKLVELVRTNPHLLEKEPKLVDAVSSAANGTDGLVRSLMAFSAIGLFAAALFYVLIKNPNIEQSSVVGNAIAALTTLLTAIVAFYFGSRANSTATTTTAATTTDTSGKLPSNSGGLQPQPPVPPPTPAPPVAPA
jgi:uncharacterized protein YneF (UPF0154 family)